MSLLPVSSVSRLAALAVLAAIPLCAGGLRADPLSDAVQGVFQRSAKAVVKIEAEDDNGRLFGTGFFVDPNGTIYTNYSVGGESWNIVVTAGDSRYPASRIPGGADPRTGLAILRIDAQKTPFLPLGKSSDLNVASLVMTIGYPLDLPVTPNVGCVGGFNIAYDGRFFAVSHIRANVPVQRGEAGAPLLNMDGQVVGILESSMDSGNGCFVLPIEAAEKVHSDAIHYGGPHPGWLGIRFNDAAAGVDAQESKIQVQGFVDGSPAEKSGMRPGDVILKVGDRNVSNIEDVMNAAFYLTAGEQVPITVLRNGQSISFNITPAENPSVPEEDTPTPPPSIFSLSVRWGTGN